MLKIFVKMLWLIKSAYVIYEWPLATKLKPVEVKPGISLATMTGELNVSNNKYHLDNFDDGNESKQGGGPAKRQRKEVSPSMIKSGIYAH